MGRKQHFWGKQTSFISHCWLSAFLQIIKQTKEKKLVYPSDPGVVVRTSSLLWHGQNIQTTPVKKSLSSWNSRRAGQVGHCPAKSSHTQRIVITRDPCLLQSSCIVLNFSLSNLWEESGTLIGISVCDESDPLDNYHASASHIFIFEQFRHEKSHFVNASDHTIK